MKLTLVLILFSASVAGQELSQITELAEQGDAAAQNKLGIMYASGNGVTRDFKKAAELFNKSANQGLPGAQYNLGRLYQSGRGVQQDNAIAAGLYGKAAEAGDAKAQYNLGFMYANGVGVERDPKAAVLWISRAADQGLPIAQQAIDRLNSITQELQQTEARGSSNPAAEVGSPESGSNAESMTTEAGHDNPTFFKDKRFWMILFPLLVGFGVYWLIRARAQKSTRV